MFLHTEKKVVKNRVMLIYSSRLVKNESCSGHAVCIIFGLTLLEINDSLSFEKSHFYGKMTLYLKQRSN